MTKVLARVTLGSHAFVLQDRASALVLLRDCSHVCFCGVAFCRRGVFFGLLVLLDGVCQNIVAFVGADTHPWPMAHRQQVLLVYVRFLD